MAGQSDVQIGGCRPSKGAKPGVQTLSAKENAKTIPVVGRSVSSC